MTLDAAAILPDTAPEASAYRTQPATPTVAEHYIATPEGNRLHYYESGAGREVILIHGALVTADDPIIALQDALAPRHHIVAFDRPAGRPVPIAASVAHQRAMNAESRAISARPRALAAPAVRRLILADFRSYPALDLPLDAHMVVLTGENGAGKTNALEALSLLSPGRGLRRADLAECARIGGRGGFAVSVEIETEGQRVQLGVGLDAPDGGEPQARRFRIDRAPAPSARALADHLRLVWQTPAMDQLFVGPASERRRFLDRLVLAVDPDHGTRVNALERALRNRNRLLEDGATDRRWIDAAEHEVAELAIAVAAARHDTVARLAALIEAQRREASPFPFAEIALDGEIDALVAGVPALAAEDRYRAILADNRGRDAAAGRTLIGPHTSDLVVRHGPKGLEARQCSTGEQKALLTGLVLAHAHLVAAASGIAPIVLLDEIAAHFDPVRRAALFDELAALGGQVWMTGADDAAFAELAHRAQILRVTPGRIGPAN